jgi:hypothetical protein
MMHEITGKTCLECNSTLRGRIDKKFCSDQCRSAFNNRLNADENLYVRRVNTILRKNRRILQELNPAGRSKIGCEKLRVKGFDFGHFTSAEAASGGEPIYFCYDQGYRMTGPDKCLLVARKLVAE